MTEADAPAPPEASAPPAHVVETLRQAALLKNFTETGLMILASVADEKVLPPGTPLFVDNMLGDAMYFIAEGRLRISVRGPDGQEHALTYLDAGQSVGEAALLRQGPRFCSATAEVETTVIEISRKDVAQLQKNKPQACLKLLMNIADVLAGRLRGTESELRRFLAWRVTQGR